MAQGRKYEIEWFKEDEKMEEKKEYFVDALERVRGLKSKGYEAKMFVIDNGERVERNSSAIAQ